MRAAGKDSCECLLVMSLSSAQSFKTTTGCFRTAYGSFRTSAGPPCGPIRCVCSHLPEILQDKTRAIQVTQSIFTVLLEIDRSMGAV